MTSPLSNKLSDCAPRRHHALSAGGAASVRGVRLTALALCALLAACDAAPRAGARAAERRAPDPAADSAARQSADSAAAMAAVRDTALARRLSPAADSIAPFLVFAPTETRAFVAAVRNKQWLLDVGRMDLDVRKDSAKTRAFREAAQVLSPVAAGSALRLHWGQGIEDVVVDSFAVYNGRIVLRVLGSPSLDSAASGKAQLVAFAERADSAAEPVPTACELRIEPDSAARAALAVLTPAARRAASMARASVDSAFNARVAFVRDSLDAVLRLERPPYERLQRRMKLATSQVRGCFGEARRALIVSLRAGDVEWVRERLVLIAPSGAVTALRVDDGRFRAHELLTAFDADGDGVDDLAVRGTTQRAGGTALLRLDLNRRRAERLVAGFAWEVF